MHLTRLSLLGLLAVHCAPTFAATYLGAGGVLAERDEYNDVDRSTGFRLLAGHRFDELPLMIELGYIDTGDADVDPLPGAASGFTFNFSGFQLGLGYFATLDDLGSGVFLKGGFYNGDSEALIPAGSIPEDPGLAGRLKQSASGANLSIGGIWKINRQVGLRFDYETLFSTKDFAADADIGLLGIGVVIEFAAPSGAGSRVEAPPAAAVPQPMPAVVPAAQAPRMPSQTLPPPARALVSGGDYAAAMSLVAKAQPRLNSTDIGTIAAGSRVLLKGQVHNGDGSWWFVQSEGVSGWLDQATVATSLTP